MKPTFLRKTLTLISEPGQRGRLPKVHGGRWRGNIRAVSEPYTDARGAVVIPVAGKEA